MTEESILADLEKVTSDSFLHDVARGIRGINQGFDNGLGRAGEFLYGLQPSTYYLIGADSGVGKTTWADEHQVIQPWLSSKLSTSTRKIKYVYFSWEISKPRKKLRFATRFMAAQWGVRLPVAYILGKGKYRCSASHWELCKAIEPQVEEIFNDIEMIDEPCNSRTVLRLLTKVAETYGTFTKRTTIGADGEQHEEITGYIPHDPNLVIEVIFDHLGLADADSGMSLKQTMDRISQQGVYFRNRCGWSFTFIQQFNNNLQSTERRKLDKSNIIPVRGDFGDSTYTFRDADVVWGLVSPAQFSFQEFQGYNVEKLGPSYIHGFLMKNRDGPPNMSYPFFMDAVAHHFEVLPSLKFDLNGRINDYFELAKQFRDELDKTDFSDQVPIKQLSA